MERFGLTRHDMMLMSWTELQMMFDSMYDDDDEVSEKKSDAPRAATAQDYANWI